MKWPFKDMPVGGVVVIWDVPPHKVAATAHNTGRYKGWSFKTETVKQDGRTGVRVTRVAGSNDAPPQVVTNKAWRDIPMYGYEHLAVGESITLTGEHEFLGRAVNGMASRERRFGIRLTRKCVIDHRQLYSKVTITRTA